MEASESLEGSSLEAINLIAVDRAGRWVFVNASYRRIEGKITFQTEEVDFASFMDASDMRGGMAEALVKPYLAALDKEPDKGLAALTMECATDAIIKDPIAELEGDLWATQIMAECVDRPDDHVKQTLRHFSEFHGIDKTDEAES